MIEDLREQFEWRFPCPSLVEWREDLACPGYWPVKGYEHIDSVMGNAQQMRVAWQGFHYGVGLAKRDQLDNPWQETIDQALVTAHLGIATSSASRKEAYDKLHELIDWHVQVATDPDVNGGFTLVYIGDNDALPD